MAQRGRSKKDSDDVILGKREMYLGNPGLPSMQATFEYTPEMAGELEKCEKDMLYFAENYFYIIDPDKGKVQINLYEYQKRLVKALKENRFNVVLSSRQSGKCFSGDTMLKIKNKKTGKIEEVSAYSFYNTSE